MTSKLDVGKETVASGGQDDRRVLAPTSWNNPKSIALNTRPLPLSVELGRSSTVFWETSL